MPLNPAKIQGICFDIDGTLHDTDDQFVFRLSRWLRPLGLIFPKEDLQKISRQIVMQTETPANKLYGLADRLGVDDKFAALNDWIYEIGLGKTVQPYKLIDGVLDMLDELSQHYQLSIVSARGKRVTQSFLESLGINHYFIAVATAQTCRHTKPYPDPIFWAARKMGIPAKNCLMVGDTTFDIIAGKLAGTQTAGVLCGFGTKNELIQKGADIILPTTSILQKVLLDK